MKHAIALAGALALSACASMPSAAPTYSGEYFYNFEFAYIAPDGSTELWCTKGDMSHAERPDGWGKTRVIVRGNLGSSGHFGTLGACTRVLTVTEVVEATNMRGRNER